MSVSLLTWTFDVRRSFFNNSSIDIKIKYSKSQMRLPWSMQPPALSFQLPASSYLVRNNVAGGSRKTSRMAGNAAARAVRIIKGSDIPSVAQSTPNVKVQPNDCRLITYTRRWARINPHARPANSPTNTINAASQNIMDRIWP